MKLGRYWLAREVAGIIQHRGLAVQFPGLNLQPFGFMTPSPTAYTKGAGALVHSQHRNSTQVCDAGQFAATVRRATLVARA
jgi:hypothetical protein